MPTSLDHAVSVIQQGQGLDRVGKILAGILVGDTDEGGAGVRTGPRGEIAAEFDECCVEG